MKQVAVIISPNYKDYAEKYLEECLASLRAQQAYHAEPFAVNNEQAPDLDIFLIDNESTDESMALLKGLAPEARLICLEKNEGFAGGNNAALKIVLEEGYEFAFILNMDTLCDAEALDRLVQAMKTEPKAGAIQARLMLWPNTTEVNSLGNSTHFLGFGYSLGYKSAYHAREGSRPEIAYPTGAAVMLRTKALFAVGLFDEEMWMYNEDQDLGWRLWLAGWSCLLEARAVVYHKYEFSRSIKKFYWMDRNRIIAMLKNYHILTLIVIAPAFIVMELGLILFSLKSGWWPEKKKVWRYFLKTKNWRYIMIERRRIQLSRVTSEKKIASLITGRIWYQEVDDIKLRFINPIFELYWKVVRSLMWW